MPARSRTTRFASVVLTTVGSKAEAAQLARALVKARLAACGTCIPGARSVYAWRGAVEEAGETLLLLKTLPSRRAALVRRLRALHPYDVPEVLVRKVEVGNPAYSSWLADWVGARA